MKFRFLRSSSPRATVPNLRQAHESSLFTQFVTSRGSPGLHASSRKLPFYAVRHLAQQFQAPRELMEASFLRISSPCATVPNLRRAHESLHFSHFVTCLSSPGHKTGWDWLKNLIGCRPLDAKTQQEVLQKSV